MPRKQLPPRLYLRTRKGREPVCVIKDNGQEHSTGCGPDDRGKAETCLGEYLLSRFRAPDAPQTPEAMGIADVLAIYATEHAQDTAAPARIGYAISALLAFWGELRVSAITGHTCRRYAKKRGASVGTVRRELGTLRAALTFCQREGNLTRAPLVELPKRPASKDRWLTRGEVAALLRVARTDPNTRHLCRFILISVYTGTRKARVLKLQFMPSLTAGYFEIEAGLLHPKGAAEAETLKRAPPCKLTRRLHAHARRWRRDSFQYAVEWRGKPVADIKNAWKSVTTGAGIEGASPHTLKHTAITWAMQRGAGISDAASYFGTSEQTILNTYHHHHPDHQSSAVAAMERR